MYTLRPIVKYSFMLQQSGWRGGLTWFISLRGAALLVHYHEVLTGVDVVEKGNTYTIFPLGNTGFRCNGSINSMSIGKPNSSGKTHCTYWKKKVMVDFFTYGLLCNFGIMPILFSLVEKTLFAYQSCYGLLWHCPSYVINCWSLYT